MIGAKKNVDIWEHSSKKTNNKNKDNILFIRKALWKRGAEDTLAKWIQILFPLYSGWRFTGNVIYYPVNTLDLINDAIRNFG